MRPHPHTNTNYTHSVRVVMGATIAETVAEEREIEADDEAEEIQKVVVLIGIIESSDHFSSCLSCRESHLSS